MSNATVARPQVRKVTKTYDLSQMSQAHIAEVREAAGSLRVKGIAVDRHFHMLSQEVDLDTVEAKAAEIEAIAAELRALIGLVKRS